MAEDKTKKDISEMTQEEIEELKYGKQDKKDTQKQEQKEETSKEDTKQKDISEMTQEEIDEIKYQQQQEKTKVAQQIIRGYNDKFTKHYNFEELGLEYDITLHLPNLLEQGQINALRSRYLGGTDTDQPSYVYYAFEMMAIIQIVGDDVPKYFKNEEAVYNSVPLIQMYQDFVEFQQSFRY